MIEIDDLILFVCSFILTMDHLQIRVFELSDPLEGS